jgi:sec-independent protein translocase protein TatC
MRKNDKAKIKVMQNNDRRPYLDHLCELQHRLLWCAFFFFSGALLIFGLSGQILDWAALRTGGLIFTAPADAFLARLHISFLGSFYLSIPLIAFHFYKFCSPALSSSSRKLSKFAVAIITIFFYLGGVFGAFIAAPFALNFFVGFQTRTVVPMLTVNAYLGFLMNMMFVFSIVFECPILMVVLTKIGLVDVVIYRRYRKQMIVIIFVISALLTPPDFISQIAMALPLCLLYEAGIFFSAQRPFAR